MSDPGLKRLHKQVAAHTSWARTADRTARTEPAREALNRRIAREYNIPDGLPPEEFARRFESARKAYYGKLAAKSVRARQLAADARAAERELLELGGEVA
jgi:hypothetical protein